jgi:2-methylfumaryl-CoA isomerase
MTDAASLPILSGLRVVEVSAFIAAPLCGLTLAQLGAEIVRVDPPGGNMDIDRLPLAPSGRSLYWASLNRGKRSVEIDYRKPDGARLVRKLVAESGASGGILVTNLPLGDELGYEALRRDRDDVIVVRLAGSPDGRSELDYTVNCGIGFPLVTGSSAVPTNHVLPAWDAIAGVTLAMSVLVAERHRRETGRGQLVELALSDVAMAMASNLGYIAEAQVATAERKADGNYLYGAYGDSFRTRDGRHVMVVAITDRQWRALVNAIDCADALESAARALGLRLDSAGGRYDARDLVSAFFRPWFARRTLEEVTAELARHSVLFGAYRTFRQMLVEDPRCSERNPIFRAVDHPNIGSVLTSTSPLRFLDARRMAPGVAPMLGQDTASTLSEWAGVTTDEISRLAAAGVIGKQ